MVIRGAEPIGLCRRPSREEPNGVRHETCALARPGRPGHRSRTTDSDLHRLRVVRRAKALFAGLADAGCERDAAGNRTLLYSHYASLVLLSLFNPVMQSLRGIPTASGFKKVQKQLGTGRASLGSLSESARVFDPALLVPLIQELLADLPPAHPGPGPRRHVPDSIPRELADRCTARSSRACYGPRRWTGG